MPKNDEQETRIQKNDQCNLYVRQWKEIFRAAAKKNMQKN